MGGGNVIVNAEQAQSIFADIDNNNFHLSPGSIAIDAGFDILGYYPFDLENNIRIWDGDNDGHAVIDIGAYEYGAPQLGKICGYITETETGLPVDYVFIKIDNEPDKFTFADSSGYFEIQLPEGIYDVYSERVFYENNIIYGIAVENEQNTEIAFNMTFNDPLLIKPRLLYVDTYIARLNWSEPGYYETNGYHVYLDGIYTATVDSETTDYTFQNLNANTTYIVGVSAIYGNIESLISEVEFIYNPLNSEEEIENMKVSIFNYPNPFYLSGNNRSLDTTISYSLPGNTRNSSIEIYNIKGQLIRELKIEDLELLVGKIIWDGTDTNNKFVSSGVYLYELIVDGKKIKSNKMLLLK